MQYIYPLILPKLSPETHTELKNSVSGTASFIIRNIKQNFPEYVEQDHYRQSYHENTNTLDSIGEYAHWLMNPQLLDMIRSDLTDQLYPVSTVNFFFQYINNGHTLSPHKDSPRNMSFLYFIYENKGLTHFYKDLVNDPNRCLYDLHEIEGPIQTYQMKQYQWYVMRHDVIHNVTHIDRPRLAVVAEFSKDYHYEDWIAQHDNLLDKSFEKFEYHKFL